MKRIYYYIDETGMEHFFLLPLNKRRAYRKWIQVFEKRENRSLSPGGVEDEHKKTGTRQDAERDE